MVPTWCVHCIAVGTHDSARHSPTRRDKHQAADAEEQEEQEEQSRAVAVGEMDEELRTVFQVLSTSRHYLPLVCCRCLSLLKPGLSLRCCSCWTGRAAGISAPRRYSARWAIWQGRRARCQQKRSTRCWGQVKITGNMNCPPTFLP